MTELKHFGNGAKPSPLASIVKFIIIVALFLWMWERDWEQTQDNRALVEVVATQQAVIEGMQCGGDMQMGLPIDRAQM